MALDSYTKFCSHFNGVNLSKEIQDSGATGHIVTLNGGANTSTAQKKFGLTSILLDGSDDYLSIPDHDDFDFSGDFTIELFVFPTASDVNDDYIANCDYRNLGSAGWGIIQTTEGSGTTHFVAMYSGGWGVDLTADGKINAGAWNHIAVVRSGTTIKLYINGVEEDSDTYAGAISSSNALQIGKDVSSASQYYDGYVSEVRISNIARTITVPTSAYTSDSNTKLLLHCNSLDIGNGNAITFVGTAKISTVQQKFGSASLLLDGDSDYVSVPDSDDWNFGNGDFTIDMWVKKTADGTAYGVYEQSDGVSTSESSIMCRLDSANKLATRFCWGSGVSDYTDVISTGTITGTAWHHIALVRYGNTVTQYIDGTADGTGDLTGKTLQNSSQIVKIGYSLAYTAYWNGYIDEVRVSKGIARWTSNFTPPTSEYGLGAYSRGYIL